MVPHMLAGGVEIFVLRLSVFLKNRGHNITVVACEREGDWWTKLEEHGIRGLCVTRSDNDLTVSHVLRLGRLLKKEKFDCVLLNHARFGNLALNQLPEYVAVIPILHNDVASVYQTAFLNASAWNVAVAVSPKLKEKALAMHPEKPIVQITHGVSTPDATTTTSNRTTPSQTLRCLFIGQLSHSHKGILLLPEIIGEARRKGYDVTLDIIGDGPDRPELLRKIEHYGLTKHISLFGIQENEVVYKELLNHHCLLLTSFFEGFGIVLLEASSTGCVPVAHNLPGITDCVITNNETGILCDIGDIQSMADALVRFCRDPDLWSTMSQAAIRKARDEFSLEKMGDSYIQLINEVHAGKYPLEKRRKRLLGFELRLFRRKDLIPEYLRHPLRVLFGRNKKGTRNKSMRT